MVILTETIIVKVAALPNDGQERRGVIYDKRTGESFAGSSDRIGKKFHQLHQEANVSTRSVKIKFYE